MTALTPAPRAALASLTSLASFAVLSLFTACAPPLKDPWGLAVLRGQAAAAAAVAAAESATPRTLQADLSLAAEAAAIPLSARLYAEPGERYRLDIFGLFTPVAASWAWEADAWRLVRHDTREVVIGTGTSFIPLPASGQPLMIPDVHAVLGFLWGQPLPGFQPARADSAAPGSGAEEGAAGKETAGEERGRVAWTYGGKPWTARFDPATGLCLEVSSPDMTVRYARHARQGARVLPREIGVWVDGARMVTLTVRERRENPPWKRDPFVLTIPPGYDSLVLAPPRR